MPFKLQFIESSLQSIISEVVHQMFFEDDNGTILEKANVLIPASL